MNTMNPNTHTYTDTPTTTTTATTMPTTSQSSEDSNTNVNSSTAVPECDGEIEVFGDFEAMDLHENLLRGIFSYGLEKPSAIQTKGIVPTAKGLDTLMHAQSGTGKTAAFSIGMLNQLDTSRPGTQALILSPTRDLALQTERVVSALGDYMKVRVHSSIGGRSGRDDGVALRSGPHVVTGTPGRVVDNIQRGSLDVRGIQTLILDEVDVMLDEGFVDAVRDVIQALNSDCQVVVVSATYTAAVHDICDKILRNPVKIVIPTEEITLAGIKQFYVDCGSNDAKIDVLLDLYSTLSAGQSVVFVNSRRRAIELGEEMDRADHTVSVIHGELTMSEREIVLQEFVTGASRVLIATDIVARGIDAQQVSVVLNVDLPHDRENYIHRIGRAGRFGRKGIAINLVAGDSHRDVAKLRELEQFYSCDISEMPSDVLEYL